MLNINRIHSDINHANLQKTDVTMILGIPYTTTVDRLKRNNWTPDDIEKLADYFGRPIAYYFDREEKQSAVYAENGNVDVAKDPGPCKECKLLRDKVKMLEKINELLEDKVKLMQENAAKKEISVRDSAQAG